MKNPNKDIQYLQTLFRKLNFNESNISNFVFISDFLHIPVFTFDHSGQWESKQIINYSEKLIDTFIDSLPEVIYSALEGTDYNFDPSQMDTDSFREKYLNLIKDICSRGGSFKDQHDLLYQLTTYVSNYSLYMKIALRTDDYGNLSPVIVVDSKLHCNNKVNKVHNKTLLLNTTTLMQ